MHADLNIHNRSRSLGLNKPRSRLLDRNYSGSPEPLNTSIHPEENNTNAPYFSITEANNVPSLLAKTSSKKLGYKSKIHKKRSLIMKTELPSIVQVPTKQPPVFIIASQGHQMSPEPQKQHSQRSGRCVAGYYLGNVDNKNRMKSRNNSSDPRTTYGNSTWNIGVTKTGGLPGLQDILEESPRGTTNGFLNAPAKQQKNMTEQSFKVYTETSIHSEARRMEESNKLLLTRSKKPSRVRNETGMGYGLKTEHTWEYLKDYQPEKSSRRKLNNESFHGESGMTEYNNESNNITGRNYSSRFDPLPSSEVQEKSYKNNFIKMVYKRSGKIASASQNDKQFEESCDNRRVAFMKKLESLQGLKYA